MRHVVWVVVMMMSTQWVVAQGVPAPPRAPAPDTVFRLALGGSPAYASPNGPIVLFDEAHNNLHRTSGPYHAFIELLREDGYRVKPSTVPWTAALLSGAQVLVVVNAIHESYFARRAPPYLSPFTARELKALRDFLSAGGGLLLIFDQMPYPGAADAALQWFGIQGMNGYAMADTTDRSGILRFRRNAGLADHPITRGRNATERIDSVVTFGGSAFEPKKKKGVVPLLVLSSNAVSYNPKLPGTFDDATSIERVGGWLQGAAFSYGRGRVVVLGEAALLAAAVQPANQLPAGLKGAPHNAQFGLNIFHWLSGVLPLR